MKNSRNLLNSKKISLRETKHVTQQRSCQISCETAWIVWSVLIARKHAVKPEFSFKEARTPGRYVVEAENLVIGYDKEKPLLPPLTFQIERGEKIALVGMNGVGKSTLLKTMLGKVQPLDGKVILGDYLEPSYFEQEVKADKITPIDDVWNAFPSMEQAQVRAALARAGLKTDHITRPLNSLSGGEQAKVRLMQADDGSNKLADL